jgi:hypothetical protein
MEYSEILKMLVLGITAGILAGLFYFFLALSTISRSRAETDAKPVPPEAVGGGQ